MKNITLFDQWKELYSSFLAVRPEQKSKDFTYKGGDINVTITADKGNYRQITARH